MQLVINTIGTIGILICFVGFIYQNRARKHLKADSTVKLQFLRSFKRAPIEDYSDTGKEFLGRSDNCAAIGVSLVLVYAILAGLYE